MSDKVLSVVRAAIAARQTGKKVTPELLHRATVPEVEWTATMASQMPNPQDVDKAIAEAKYLVESLRARNWDISQIAGMVKQMMNNYTMPIRKAVYQKVGFKGQGTPELLAAHLHQMLMNDPEGPANLDVAAQGQIEPQALPQPRQPAMPPPLPQSAPKPVVQSPSPKPRQASANSQSALQDRPYMVNGQWHLKGQPMANQPTVKPLQPTQPAPQPKVNSQPAQRVATPPPVPTKPVLAQPASNVTPAKVPSTKTKAKLVMPGQEHSDATNRELLDYNRTMAGKRAQEDYDRKQFESQQQKVVQPPAAQPVVNQPTSPSQSTKAKLVLPGQEHSASVNRQLAEASRSIGNRQLAEDQSRAEFMHKQGLIAQPTRQAMNDYMAQRRTAQQQAKPVPATKPQPSAQPKPVYPNIPQVKNKARLVVDDPAPTQAAKEPVTVEPMPVPKGTGQYHATSKGVLPVAQKAPPEPKPEKKPTATLSTDDAECQDCDHDIHALFLAYLHALVKCQEATTPEEEQEAQQHADALYSMLVGDEEAEEEPDIDGVLKKFLSTIPDSLQSFVFLDTNSDPRFHGEWTRYQGKRGGMGWKNNRTGRVVYTSNPNPPGYGRRSRQASQERARDLGTKYAAFHRGTGEALTADELHELTHHIQALPVHSLRNLRGMLQHKWGNAKRRAEMAEALTGHVKGLLNPQAQQQGAPVAEQAQQAQKEPAPPAPTPQARQAAPQTVAEVKAFTPQKLPVNDPSLDAPRDLKKDSEVKPDIEHGDGESLDYEPVTDMSDEEYERNAEAAMKRIKDGIKHAYGNQDEKDEVRGRVGTETHQSKKSGFQRERLSWYSKRFGASTDEELAKHEANLQQAVNDPNHPDKKQRARQAKLLEEVRRVQQQRSAKGGETLVNNEQPANDVEAKVEPQADVESKPTVQQVDDRNMTQDDLAKSFAHSINSEFGWTDSKDLPKARNARSIVSSLKDESVIRDYIGTLKKHGFVTDGKFAMLATPKMVEEAKDLPLNGSSIPDPTNIMPPKEKTIPTKISGTQKHGALGHYTAMTDENGHSHVFQSKYISDILANYPNAEMRVKPKSDDKNYRPTVAFYQDGKPVGLVVGITGVDPKIVNNHQRLEDFLERDGDESKIREIKGKGGELTFAKGSASIKITKDSTGRFHLFSTSLDGLDGANFSSLSEAKNSVRRILSHVHLDELQLPRFVSKKNSEQVKSNQPTAIDSQPNANDKPVAQADEKPKSEALRISQKLASKVVGDIARNGYSVRPEGFHEAYSSLSDEEKKQVVKDLAKRGLIGAITARKRTTVSSRELFDEVEKSASNMKLDHQGVPTNRHIPFEDSDAYKKAVADSGQSQSKRGRKPKAKADVAPVEGKPTEVKPEAKGSGIDEESVYDAMSEGYDRLKQQDMRINGIVKIPELHDEVKKRIPNLSREDFHNLLAKWKQDDRLSLQVVNDRHLEPRSDEAFIDGHKNLFYIRKNDGHPRNTAKPIQPTRKDSQAIPQDSAPSPVTNAEPDFDYDAHATGIKNDPNATPWERSGADRLMELSMMFHPDYASGGTIANHMQQYARPEQVQKNERIGKKVEEAGRKALSYLDDDGRRDVLDVVKKDLLTSDKSAASISKPIRDMLAKHLGNVNVEAYRDGELLETTVGELLRRLEGKK